MATDTGSLLGQLLGAALSGGSVRGAGAGAPQGGLPGGLGDVLSQVLAGAGQQGGGAGGSAGGLGDILGQVLGGAAGGPAGGAGGSAGGLGDILGQVLGGAAGGQTGGQAGGQAGGAGGPAGGLGDILGQVLGGAGGAAAGGAAAGGLGGLIGSMLGGGGSSAGASGGAANVPVPAPQPTTPSADGTEASGMGDLVKYGGMAVIGMMAFNAFRKWQAESAGATAGLPHAAQNFSPAAAPGGAAAFSEVLVKAMAAAAQADGKLDQDELNRITGGLSKMGTDAPSQMALIQALSTPVNPQELVDAATSPEAAMQIYAASVLAIRPDSAVEQQYLANLAAALGIDPALKAQIDKDLTA